MDHEDGRPAAGTGKAAGMTTEERAEQLLLAVMGALAAGARHYNRAGRLLTHPREILECLRDEKTITIEEPLRGSRDP